VEAQTAASERGEATVQQLEEVADRVEPFSASAAERLRDAADRIADIDNECPSGFCESPTPPPATGGDAS
jgi:hypothetical protein